MVVWMNEKPLELNGNYIIKRATSVINGTFKSIEFKKDINTFKEMATDKLELNDIAKCTLALDRQIAVDPYNKNRHTGSFIIIDRYNNTTVGAGMIVESVQDSEFSHQIKEYTDAEKALNQYIRDNFPEWGCKEIF
jgi:sulfate adenylyltransferase subunit 1